MVLKDLYHLLKIGHVQAQGVVDTMIQPIVLLDQGLCLATANNAFLETFELERDDVLGGSFFKLGDGQWDIPELRHLLANVVPKAIIGYELKHNFPSTGQRTFLVVARRLVQPDNNTTNILVLFDDVTERQRLDSETDFIISGTRHRLKNLFAVLRSVAMRTEVEGRTPADYRDILLGRLDVTLRAQEIAATCEPADFEALLRQSVGAVVAERLFCEALPSS